MGAAYELADSDMGTAYELDESDDSGRYELESVGSTFEAADLKLSYLILKFESETPKIWKHSKSKSGLFKDRF